MGPRFRGDDIECDAIQRISTFTDSIFKQPREITPAPEAQVEHLASPQNIEGRGAPEGAIVLSRFSRFA
jgi:hypothetical protein